MHIYIDESGSMTYKTESDNNKRFIMCLVLVEDSKKLKRVYKRFISKNIEELKKIDIESKMFEDGKFSELKGSCLTPEMKRSFV